MPLNVETYFYLNNAELLCTENAFQVYIGAMRHFTAFVHIPAKLYTITGPKDHYYAYLQQKHSFGLN